MDGWLGYPPLRSSQFPLVGKHLARIAGPNDTLAAGAAGAIPYYSGLFTYDTLGLNDRYIAHLPMPASHIAFGHDRGDGLYILSKRPTYLLAIPFLTPAPDPGSGFEKSFREIFALEAFGREYRFDPLPTAAGYINLYRRREAAVSDRSSALRPP